MMIKSWMVKVRLYLRKKPKRKDEYLMKVEAPNEQTVRRLVLDAAHKDGKFVDEFLEIERITK